MLHQPPHRETSRKAMRVPSQQCQYGTISGSPCGQLLPLHTLHTLTQQLDSIIRLLVFSPEPLSGSVDCKVCKVCEVK